MTGSDDPQRGRGPLGRGAAPGRLCIPLWVHVG
jgi:hypothetical protein